MSLAAMRCELYYGHLYRTFFLQSWRRGHGSCSRCCQSTWLHTFHRREGVVGVPLAQAIRRSHDACGVGNRAAKFHDHSYPRLRELQPSGRSVPSTLVPCTTCMHLTLVLDLLQQLLVTHLAEICQIKLPFRIQICCTQPTRRCATSRDLCIFKSGHDPLEFVTSNSNWSDGISRTGFADGFANKHGFVLSWTTVAIEWWKMSLGELWSTFETAVDRQRWGTAE